jgi:hypothetical protein
LDIIKWTKLNGECTYGQPKQQTCDAADALGKKLIARGYCLYGHGTVGKTGERVKSEYWKGEYRTRCYTITNIPPHSFD